MKLPSLIAGSLLILLGQAVASTRAEDAGDETAASQQNVKLAEKLISNTVTVRILPGEMAKPASGPAESQGPAKSDGPARLESKVDGKSKSVQSKAAAGDGSPQPADGDDRSGEQGDDRDLADRGLADVEKSSDSVTVCTGVALGNGRVVTFSPGATTFRYRVTLPDGGQAEAKIEVADEYSGLKLLRISNERLPGLALSAEAPQAGSIVWTAAASGIERPSISRGIVSATERSVGNAALPAMLQCDLRTTETSSGAGVIDQRGQLVGVVAATDSPDERRGWTYAVPVSHVARIVRQARPGKLIELGRRRPTVGWTIGPGQRRDTVVVERVFQGGPAERAGVERGDVVCQTDERVIRNAYQAVNLILNKQPGDKVRVVVEKEGRKRQLDIILGDGSSLLPAGAELRDREQVLRSLTVPLRINENNELERAVPPSARLLPRASQRSELEMLRKQLDAYELIIRRQQEQLLRLERLQRELNEQSAPKPTAPSGDAP